MKHTAFQYFSTTFSSFYRSEASELLQGDRTLKTRRYWISSLYDVRKKEKSLCYCAECAKEERRQYGEPYWHTLHQINGVRFCPIHKIPLTKSNATFCSKSNQYFPAYYYTKEQEAYEDDIPFKQELLNLSDDVNWLLHNGWKLGDVSEKYYLQIVQKSCYRELETNKESQPLKCLNLSITGGSLPGEFIDMLGVSRSQLFVF